MYSTVSHSIIILFFFNDTATTEIYTYLHTLSLHDALPISSARQGRQVRSIQPVRQMAARRRQCPVFRRLGEISRRSEEHTSELQSLMRISYAVFCLKKKNHQINTVIWLTIFIKHTTNIYYHINSHFATQHTYIKPIP